MQSQSHLLFTYIVDSFTLNFADIIWSWGCFLNHLHGDRGKDSVLAPLTSEVSTLVLVSSVEAIAATISSELVSAAEARATSTKAAIVVSS